MKAEELKTMDSFKLSLSEIVEEIREYYNENYGKIDFDGETLVLKTGGWSDNEKVIYSLMDNVGFWAMYWQKSERGGKYTFQKRSNK